MMKPDTHLFQITSVTAIRKKSGGLVSISQLLEDHAAVAQWTGI